MFFWRKTFPLSFIYYMCFADLVTILLVVEGHHRCLGVRDPGDGGHVVRNILHHPVTILINLGKKIEAGAVPTELPSQGQQGRSS